MGTAWRSSRGSAADPTPEDTDPGDGGKVTRCRTCGLPSTPVEACVVCHAPKRGGKLVEGVFVVRGKAVAKLRLCEADLWALIDRDPRAGDELRVEEGAA